MQIKIQNGSVEYDGEPILTEINFTVHDKEKIAVVGRNGSGKTTLLKAVSGLVPLVSGTGTDAFGFFMSGNPVIGYLKQTFDGRENKSLEEEILSAYSDILETEKQMESALEKLNADGCEKNAKTYSALIERFEFLGGYTYKKEYHVALKKFGFTESDLNKPLNEFSGGQRTKIALLTLLLSKPEVLLLDEPTNHLDLEATLWLENYLINYKNSCIIVSHDRMFLDKIVNVVYEIEYGETKRYKGNYSDFVFQKRADYDKALKDSVIKEREIKRLSALVERFRYKANKAKMAQAKIKQIARLGDVNYPTGFDNSTFHANFVPKEESVDKVFIFENLSFGYEKPFGTVNTVIKKGQKVGIIGKNGCGKSTLIKTIMGIIPSLSGQVKKGLHAQIGYFDQTLTQNYSALSVMDDFHNEFPSLSDEEVRRSLGAFLFSGEDVFKTVGELSGGEKVRLALAKIFKRRPNVLILDEPTNHMDIIGKDTLEKMLANYPGTVITVSHDRYYINKVCDRLFVFENGTLNLYDCSYTEYEQLKPKDDVTEDVKEKQITKKEKPVSSEKEKAKREHRIAVLEEKIAVFDKKKEQLNTILTTDESVFSDYKKVTEITTQLEQLEKEEQPLLDEWEKLMEE